MCAIKDYYYEDNTFSSELQEDKICIGKVFDVNSANSYIENSGVKFIIANNDYTKDGLSEFLWRTDYESINCEYISINNYEFSSRLDGLYTIKSSLWQNRSIWKSNLSNYEAVMSLHNNNDSADEYYKEWFIPTLFQWQRILSNLLGVTINKDGHFFYNDIEEYEAAKDALNLSGQYWIFPFSFSDKRLFYIDFDYECVFHTKVSDGKKCKIRPILMIQ